MFLIFTKIGRSKCDNFSIQEPVLNLFMLSKEGDWYRHQFLETVEAILGSKSFIIRRCLMITFLNSKYQTLRHTKLKKPYFDRQRRAKMQTRLSEIYNFCFNKYQNLKIILTFFVLFSQLLKINKKSSKISKQKSIKISKFVKQQLHDGQNWI